MKIIILVLLIYPIFTFPQEQDKYNLPQLDNVNTLTRTVNSNNYFDRIGHKAALMGTEEGSFELWIWPWKVLRSFELQFFLGSSTIPLKAKDIVREISVTPEATEITYTFESFKVKSTIFIPVNETAAVIVLDVYTIEPLSIVPGFIPVMQPQWPAGIGGQYSYWDDDVRAYVISESKQRGLFLCGSPYGSQMTAPPAHMFADNPIQFKINVHPDSVQKLFPIIIAGSPVKTKYDSVKAYYADLIDRIPELFSKNEAYFKELNNSTLYIETPDKKLNLAYYWGKTALHNLLVENPTLGKGLVAGYGLSGGGGRPGFAWYFGGDAFINSLAMSGYQDFETVRTALSFVQKWQRQDNYPIRKKNPDEVNIDVGKIAHELSQSEGLIDWWNDYHFGYNHADTSPWYIVAMGDYYRSSGDVQFIKESWESLKQAYRWCLSKDSNNDGLMDLKGAGLGVLEFGSLVKIHNDIYTQALWTQALKDMRDMSFLFGDAELRQESEELYKKAIKSLEEIYWIDDLGFYSFGANESGEQVREKSIYSSAALMFKLMDEKKSLSTLKNFNHSDMMTDWGVRNLSNKSELYHPSNYNYGTVWPFTSALIGTAEYNYKFSLQGYKILRATAKHMFEYGLGVSPEVISGDMNQKLNEAYHNQGFSYTGFMLPFIKGLAGLQINASEKTASINFSPQIPADWDFLNISNIRVRENKISLNLIKQKGKFKLTAVNSGDDRVLITFSPGISPGSKIDSFAVDDLVYTKEPYRRGLGENEITLMLTDTTGITAYYKIVPELYLLEEYYPVGSLNQGLKIVSVEAEDSVLIVETEGLPGMVYEIGLMNPETVKGLNGAELDGDKLKIKINDSDKNEFITHQVRIEF